MNRERPLHQFQPKERAAAFKDGLKQYFTGRPCKHGHVAFRCTSSGACKVCDIIKQKRITKERLQNDPDYYKKQYARKPDYYKALAAGYRQRNPEAVRETLKRSIQKRKPQKTAAQMLRHASKLQATPPWLSKEDLAWIQTYYDAAQAHKQTFGIVLAVDHIVPLQGKEVCGLHVPWNLCLRTKSDNSKKHNKLTSEAYLPQQAGVLVMESALPWNLKKDRENGNRLASIAN